MRDLILEIIVSLVIAAIIGFVIGWLFKHLFCKGKLAKLQESNAALELQGGKLRGQLGDRDATITKLQSDAAEGGSDPDLRAELTKAEARLIELDKDLSQCQADLDACQSAKESTPQATPAPAAAPTPAAPAAPTAPVAPASPAATPTPAPGDRPDWLMSSPSEGDPDDLKKIWGVGPVLEKTMNNLGIYYYRQVAKLNDHDVQWVADNINAFPDRIKRDRWIEQANDLHKDKYNSEP